jgi:hypothetical protein
MQSALEYVEKKKNCLEGSSVAKEKSRNSSYECIYFHMRVNFSIGEKQLIL